MSAPLRIHVQAEAEHFVRIEKETISMLCHHHSVLHSVLPPAQHLPTVPTTCLRRWRPGYAVPLNVE
eukprot:SAG11_NODE_37760_length_255_cov_0.980769_1_plen_66_part_10